MLFVKSCQQAFLWLCVKSVRQARHYYIFHSKYYGKLILYGFTGSNSRHLLFGFCSGQQVNTDFLYKLSVIHPQIYYCSFPFTYKISRFYPSLYRLDIKNIGRVICDALGLMCSFN